MNIYELRKVIGKRLHARQLQGATYGMSVDPSVTIEAENLQKFAELLDLLISMEKAGRPFADMRPIEAKVIRLASSVYMVLDSLEYE